MVTRFDKSSKTRNGAEYILIWRTIRDFGEGGKRVVMKAIAGDAKALDQVEEMASFRPTETDHKLLDRRVNCGGRYQRLRPNKMGWKLPVLLSSNHSATTGIIKSFDNNSEGGSGKQRAAATPRPKERPKTLKARSKMSTTEAASKVFEEIPQLFGSGPTDEQILNFRPSVDVAQRASQLLSLIRTGKMDDDLKHELDQYEQAELLMRMVKAQIRARQGI